MRDERVERKNLRDGMRSSVHGEPHFRANETAAPEPRGSEPRMSAVPAVDFLPSNRAVTPAGASSQTPNTMNDGQILDFIRAGIKHGHIDLFLQPIVTLPQRTLRFYECYSRIRGADGSMMMPAQYIELARDHGLLDAIDNILLLRCVQLVRKAQRHNHNLGFICNLSMQVLGERAFFNQFIDFMGKNRNLATRLMFELAAEDVFTQWAEIAGELHRLARLGFRFSMDRVKRLDFDPALLARRHFKFVKVDAATLLNGSRDGGRAVRLLKQDLVRHGIDLIVEKVETQDQLVELLDLGVYFGQGYLFGEPRRSRAA